MTTTRTTYTADPMLPASGTSYQGHLDGVTLDQLVVAFGRPSPGDGVKTESEWVIRFSDGTIATVYDYKGSRWNVGGFSTRAFDLVLAVVR